MEPITILSATAAVSAIAGKSWELVNWIRDFYQGSKTVDERVRRLESGMTELASACQSVLAALERTQPGSSSTTLTPPWDEDGRSAMSIDRQVKNCRKTLKELEKVLAPLRPGSNGRASRHMKFQDRAKQIEALSSRIKTHTDALQMSLQTVIIKIVLTTPDFVLRQLDEALQDISMRLARMEVNTRRGSSDRQGIKGDNEDPLIELAQDALQRGTTLYKASVAGTSVGVESVMDGETALSIGKWIHEVNDEADTCTPQHDRPCLAPAPNDSSTPTTHTPVEVSIAAVSGEAETSRGAHCESTPASTVKAAPTAVSSDSPRLQFDFSRPSDQWDQSEIVSQFNIVPDGWLEVMICAGTTVDPKDLSRLEESEYTGATDAEGHPSPNTLALHLAVLFQDLHLVKSLVNAGYSPNISATLCDTEPLWDALTPTDIAIASHCEPITKVLLEHGAQLNPSGGVSPCLQLLATTSLDLWPSTEIKAYTRVLKRLLAYGFVWPSLCSRRPDSRTPWTRSVLQQICDLPHASAHLRWSLTNSMLEYCAEFWRPYSNDCSPLQVTIRLHDPRTLEYLLEQADAQGLEYVMEFQDWKGRTPLHYAIEQVKTRSELSLEVVRVLLERGASLADTSVVPERYLGGLLYVGFRGTTIRDIAMRSDRTDLKELIAQYP